MRFQTSPLILCLSLIALPAQSNWFDQGADLLKNIQSVTEQKSDNKQDALPNVASNLSSEEIEKAFKQALSKGSETVVQQLSVKDGFNKDPSIHIPLPKELKQVKDALSGFGMSGLMDDLETKLNRAAEAATPEAKSLFIGAIQQMTFEDVQTIYQGPKDSATQYLKSKTSPSLKGKMAPIVNNALSEVGALEAYDKAIKEYKNLPFVPDVKADLQNHVINKGMDGMFHYIAQEEISIRKDPVKQTTDLLKKVFGQ